MSPPESHPGTAAAVAGLVAQRLGLGVRSVERMTFGHGSVTFKVQTDSYPVIVRTNTDPSVYAGTGNNLGRLAEIGVPVPRVLHEDLSRRDVPFAYLITDAFDGRDLRFELAAMTREQQTRLAEQVVAFECAAIALPEGGGYGFAPLGVRAPHERWIDAVRADRSQIDAGTDVTLAELTDEAYRLLDQAEPRLELIEPTCFLDDLTIKNVIVSDGVLAGVVDFDVVCFGDPMYWLALTQVAVVSDVGREGEWYVRELERLWDLSNDDERNLALYSALHAAAFLTWDRDDAPRRHRLIASMRASLGRAGGG